MLTAEEQQQKRDIQTMQHDITEIKSDINALTGKVDKVLSVIVGNEYGANGSVVHRLEMLETKVETMEKIANNNNPWLSVIKWIIPIVVGAAAVAAITVWVTNHTK